MAKLSTVIFGHEEALRKAKEAVQTEYKKQGFELTGMPERLNITLDRGMYKESVLRL